MILGENILENIPENILRLENFWEFLFPCHKTRNYETVTYDYCA
jgi:hypothetical protein